MLSFIKSFFWRQSQQIHTSAPSKSLPEENRKRKPSAADQPIDPKRIRAAQSIGTAGWNLDLEQADYRFSQETIAIFKGAGPTVLVSRRPEQSHICLSASLSGHRQSVLGLQPHQSIRQDELIEGNLSRAISVLRRMENLPAFCPPEPPQRPKRLPQAQQSQAAAAAASKLAPLVHSTPLPAAAASAMSAEGAGHSGRGAAAAAASTMPKYATAAASQRERQRPADDDDDCVITSVEGPKSVAEMFSPCRYLAPNWIDDIKTSNQSLKSYMKKEESEAAVKLQHYAKLRELDERDLVGRMTRNLKLAERELPVLPYRYEEPPPTPPPSPPPPEPAEVEFPQLTEAQLGAVERAWSRQLPGSEVLAEGFSLRVTREELRSLCGLNWLNDNVVNFYMQLLAAREGPGLPKVHAFSTFFYTKLSTGGYASVRRWTRKVDIFDRDVLLCPVHLHNNHWTLSIVDLRSRYILHLDSLSRGGGGDPTCLALLRQYLIEEHRDKKGAELSDASEFRLVREAGAPQQENGSDCGVFCCKFADYYCKGREFTFGQANMPYFRKRTTLEILEKRLMW